MPGATTNFAIPYPCAGETIDCTIFEAFTQAIQDALTGLDSQSVDVLNRPAASVTGGGQNIAVNVSTNATYTSESYDNDNMADLTVNNDRLTIVTPGMYMITGYSSLGSGFTTITSNAVAITVNGTVLYRKKNSSDTNLAMNVTVTGLVNCLAGDIIRTSILWTGTGGPVSTFTSTLSARLVAI